MKKRLLWVRLTQLAFVVCLFGMALSSANFASESSLFTQPIGDFRLLYILLAVFIVRGGMLIWLLASDVDCIKNPPVLKRGVVCETILVFGLVVLAYYSL